MFIDNKIKKSGKRIKKSMDKEKYIEKKMDIDPEVIDMEKRIVGGVVTQADEVDGQGDLFPYDVVEDMAHEYMKTSQIISYMHGNVANLKKFLKSIDAIQLYETEDGREIAGVDFEKLENAVEIEKKMELDYEIPGKTQFGAIVDSMFFSDEIMNLIESGKIKRGTWFMNTEVLNDQVLEKIKNKEIRGYSTSGVGLVEVDEDGKEKE